MVDCDVPGVVVPEVVGCCDDWASAVTDMATAAAVLIAAEIISFIVPP
jgi:hypothetical protein